MSAQLLAIACAVCWACRAVLLAPVASEQKSTVIVAMRCGIAISLLTPVLVLSVGEPKSFEMPPAALGWLSLISAPAFFIGAALFYWSIDLIGVARAFPLTSTHPIFSTALAVLFLGEKPSFLTILGIALIAAGIWLMAMPVRNARTAPVRNPSWGHRFGAWVALGSAALWAVSIIGAKQALLNGAAPLMANGMRMAIVFIIAVATISLWNGASVFRRVPLRSWGYVFLAAVIGDVVGELLFLYALEFSAISMVVPLAATAPLFAIPVGRVVVGERFTCTTVLGTFSIVTGVLLVLTG